MLDEKLHDCFRLFCGDDKIDIANDFSSPPVASGQIDMERVRLRREIGAKCFGFACDLPELKRTDALGLLLDGLAKFFLRRFTEAGQSCDPARCASLTQLFDRTDFQLLVKRLNFFVRRGPELKIIRESPPEI